MKTLAPPTQRFGVPMQPMAIDESALAREWEPHSLLWEDLSPPKPYRMVGAVAVVEVVGALDTRGGWWWLGYDDVESYVSAALSDPAVKAVVLALDSPGGMAAGNMDCARSLRALADAAGKPLVAHAGTYATSAAYALAVSADAVLLTVDGVVGSIGTIATVYDRTKATADAGLDVRVVRSGPLKADPHPDVPLTDASVSRVRARINELAGMFAAWVSERRPAMGDPLALQGASIYGADAVTRGLADAVGTLADAIDHAASLAAATATKRKTTMDNAKAQETLSALRASLGAQTDEEALAAVATLRQRAGQADTLGAELVSVRAELAARDAAALAAAREGVLAKHRQRGALTPAMEADTAFMGDLAPLSAEALDRVLSRLAGAPAAVAPRAAAGVDPAAAPVELTAEERAFAKAHGLSEEALLSTKRADAARAAALTLND